MKVYALPDELAATVPNWGMDKSREQLFAEEEAHRAGIVEWIKAQGFTGKHTGRVYRTSIADGYAEYMMADGRGSFLLHLPYGDGYQSRDVQFLPKGEVIKRIDADERMRALFK